ncbi:MAG TPA: transglycosylase family protein [Acidimicrobiia bacterium]|jgi:hypothetical protein
MRKRTLLVVVPLVIVVLVAGAAFAVPRGEHADDAKLDKLHVVRPTAASPQKQDSAEKTALLAASVQYVQASLAGDLSGYLDWLSTVLTALVTPPPPPPAAPVTRSAPVYAASGNGGFLACVKQRESGGDYAVHNYQGSGASGAYQMMPGTWNSIAASAGRTDLVGLDPAAASPGDQDAMAAALYAQQGAAPWGGGC